MVPVGIPNLIRAGFRQHFLLALFIIFSFLYAGHTLAAGRLHEFLPKAHPGDFFSGADRFGAAQGDPPLVPAYRGDELLGWVYLASDLANATGYSGKPIHLLVGIDPQGIVRGIKLVDHKEPIVLLGIPERRIVDSLNMLVGRSLAPVASGAERPPQVDIISGATVTVLVMADSVVRSAVRLIRSGRLDSGGQKSAAVTLPPATVRSVDPSTGEIRDWESLLGDGSVRRLSLSVGEVSEAFRRVGNTEAAGNEETGDPADTFIDLYVAPVSVPAIGRSLLGETAYDQLRARLATGQQAIVVAGDGAYSFKGSGYVRGGIFDRIELLQEGQSTRFRDRNHTRLGDLAAEGAPALREIALFVVPTEFRLDLTEPWQLQLLVQRNVGARDKAFLPYDIEYALPDRYVKVAQLAPPPTTAPQAPQTAIPTQVDTASPPARRPSLNDRDAIGADDLSEPLWVRIWKMNTVSIGITTAALIVLTGIFFFQDALVRRPVVYTWVRRAYLLFSLFWLGWYANAQLSVVNVLTFTNSLMSGFNWDFFLAAPLIFILWASVAAALLFWGRGPFCGWLCPFGALQELTNTLARWAKVPQITVPWGLHERLWPIKYMVFLGLFGLSLYSVALAEIVAEVEPFKTAIVLKFAREWPFVVYALTLLAAGLFIERFFCRYLCPLGAALAIPGRIRMFEWLKRWPECGSPCQRCAKECPVQSIHPEGQINVNECIYCMHCQELYHDDHRCPHMIQVRLKREKREALSSLSMRQNKESSAAPARTTLTHMGKPIRDATAADVPTISS
jgi:NosR/NirI family nitrous oxide reductase transcriptional regulator